MAPAAVLLRLARSIAAGALLLALASPAAAQYFGRNKVRYRAFDFQVLRTEHFDIYFYSSERRGIDIAARLAERWHARLERLLAHSLSGRQPLILYGSHAEFEQTNVISEELGDSTGGVTEPVRRRIILPLAGPLAETDHVLGHEIVHAFQFDMTQAARGATTEPAALRLPLWFIEGMAEYLSLGRVDAYTAMKLRDAMRHDRLPTIRDLEGASYFPYQWGHAVVAYIAGRYGDEVLWQLLRSAAAAGDVGTAIAQVLGVSDAALSADWHEAIRTAYAPVLAASLPLDDARLLINGDGLGADLNVGPTISPDGRWVAFLSSRSLFSIDLYVADAATGRIARKLTSTASERRMTGIDFVHSAGAWDPASERIAIAAVVDGRPALAIMNSRTGRREREIAMAGIDQILNPAWSPDARRIAFTGLRQGVTDLFVYDLAAARLTQITDDAYADLHPSWAPDSARLVFASDRFSSDLTSLRMGPTQLAIVDTRSGAIAPVAALAAGRHLNPQWSPDGTAVSFIGDPDGVANVYRLSLATGVVEELTALATGVSGITPSSPALSVSAATGRLAMTVYEDDEYHIYIREPEQPGWPIATLPVNADALPPTGGAPGSLAALLSNPDDGLPAVRFYPAAPYKPGLSLIGLSQPDAGIGVGRFGPVVSGGAALVFGDALGDHVLATAVQLNSGMVSAFHPGDIAVDATYLNLSRRWSWGVAASQVPYLAGAISRTVSTSATGDAVDIERQIAYRQVDRRASGILAYPFDRARRLELRGGLSQTSFESTIRMTASSRTSGATSDTSETAPLAPALRLFTTAAALVLDNTLFGPIGPIRGERYRLEVSPALGSIAFVGVLADYRRYVMPVPFVTVAARVLHYGRYGGGSEDARLAPVHVDGASFVRGYDAVDGTIECASAPTGDCRGAGQLAGSRMLVGNVELRLPLLRPLGLARSMYGPVPIELAIFADSGVAWTSVERPSIVGGTRPGVGSAGVALRVALGPLVGELDAARPFERSGRGWVLGFNLMPSW